MRLSGPQVAFLVLHGLEFYTHFPCRYACGRSPVFGRQVGGFGLLAALQREVFQDRIITFPLYVALQHMR